VLLTIKNLNGNILVEHNDPACPYTFSIGQNKVIKALELAVQSMTVGEKALFISDPEYAHVSSGFEGLLPDKEDIHIEITLLKSVEEKKCPWEFDEDERKAIALSLKNDGNEFFKMKLIEEARNTYNKALKYIEDDNGEDIDELKFSLYNNLVLMNIKLTDYQSAIEAAQKGIALNFKNVKIWFRKSQALSGLHRYEEALEDLRQALIIDPYSEETLQEINRVKEKIKAQEARDKKFYASMFKSE